MLWSRVVAVPPPPPPLLLLLLLMGEEAEHTGGGEWVVGSSSEMYHVIQKTDTAIEKCFDSPFDLTGSGLGMCICAMECGGGGG